VRTQSYFCASVLVSSFSDNSLRSIITATTTTSRVCDTCVAVAKVVVSVVAFGFCLFVVASRRQTRYKQKKKIPNEGKHIDTHTHTRKCRWQQVEYIQTNFIHLYVCVWLQLSKKSLKKLETLEGENAVSISIKIQDWGESCISLWKIYFPGLPLYISRIVKQNWF